MKNLLLVVAFVTIGITSVNAQDLNPYHYIIKKTVKISFKLVNEHRYDEVLKGMSDKTLEHSFAGDLL